MKQKAPVSHAKSKVARTMHAARVAGSNKQEMKKSKLEKGEKKR